MKIWTKNLQTGLADEYEAVVDLDKATAVYRKNYWTHTLYGGFYLDKESADKASREGALAVLAQNKEYADRLYDASGIKLEEA
jgi:hypothetical protein